MIRTAMLFLLAAPAGLAAAANALSFKVSNETAPAGSIVQMKLKLTEPKPIFTGSADFSSDSFDSYWGLALNNPSGDASGVALMRAGGFKLTAFSPSADLGTNIDYPVFTFAARINAGAANGSKYTVGADAAGFLDLFGFQYTLEMKPGTLTVGKSVVISDVSPGSALLGPGSVVTIRGQGFTPDTRIRFKETDVTASFVSSTEMQIRLGSAADMHGMMVKATNKDGTSSTYYSYQRTLPGSASQHPVLARCEPVFARRSWTEAVFVSAPQTGGQFFGFAFQNLGPAAATVTVELRDIFGKTLATGTLIVPENTRVARAAGELIGAPAPLGTTWRFTSTAPVQMLQIAGAVAPEAVRHVIPVFSR